MWRIATGGALALTLLVTPAEAQETMTDSAIARYEGSGISTLRPFTADGPWEATWSAEGDLFQMWTETEQPGVGRVPLMLANQSPAGDGSSYQAKPGKFALTVNAIGDWEVVVRAVE